jgi:hypothetical protein
LFTDDEDMIANFKRCIGLNGINLASARPDLIDRGLIYEPEPISEEDRKLEEEIWSEFEKLRPQVLAYIFDILVEVLKVKQNGGIKLARLPRMADFALHCEIISRCMGNPPEAFINAFAKNIEVQTIESIASNSVAVVIIEFMRDKLEWTGTATTLHSQLESKAIDLGINTWDKSWPKSPNALSRKLNEVKTSLRKTDISIENYTLDLHTGLKGIKITKTSSASSASSANKKTTENRAQITSDIGNDIADDVLKNETHGAHPFTQIAKKLGNYLAFDLEWDANNNNVIDAVSFVDSDGNCEVKLRDRDFAGSEPQLLDYINSKLLQYRWSMGWNTQGRFENSGGNRVFDLLILHQRCKANNVTSIIKLGKHGLPYIASREHQHIDLLNVYSKEMVKDGMYKGKYRTNKLNDVSKALLGYGKYNNYSGAEFKTLPVDEQVKYSLQDSQLVMDLSKYRDFEVLDAMLALAEETGVDFQRICQTTNQYNILTLTGVPRSLYQRKAGMLMLL